MCVSVTRAYLVILLLCRLTELRKAGGSCAKHFDPQSQARPFRVKVPYAPLAKRVAARSVLHSTIFNPIN